MATRPPNPRGYFVTGTGTGVGKTFVACALARQGRLGGRRVLGFKPIETGCVVVDGHLVGADQELLCAAAGDWQREELRGIYRFEPPIAPVAAAELSGVEITLDAIASVVATGATLADLLVVEGAGGWRVPLTHTLDMSHLAQRLGFPVVVVGAAALGTINHSLLTVEAVERDVGAVAALVLSKRPEDEPGFVADNVRRIAARWGGLILVCQADTDLSPLV